MRKVEITLYSFDELSDEAKKNVLRENIEINVKDCEWVRDVKEEAQSLGFKIDSFDIASFCKISPFQHAVDIAIEIIDNHGESCETYKTAKGFLDKWDKLVSKYSDQKNKKVVAEDKIEAFDFEAINLEVEFFKKLADDYKDILNNQYHYLISDEAIIETIQSNEYEFTEKGKIFK